MKVLINVSAPILENIKNGNRNLKITLKCNLGFGADVNINFTDLQQFIIEKNRESLDFFIISTIVYGIDRLIERRPNSINGWSRELKVSFPVSNTAKWNFVKNELSELLSFLTGDYWEISFYKYNFSPNSEELDKSFKKVFSQVNLFSGGLDSLIGALEYLKTNKKGNIILASQYDPEMKGPKKDQEDLLSLLKTRFPERIVNVPSIMVSLGKIQNNTGVKEKTFRARSILFIGIGCLIANKMNLNLIVPENGTVSLNFPLSASRRSACSTRTTHPHLIELIVTIWKKIGIKSQIINPYEFKTKGEMASLFKEDDFSKELFLKSNSCGKRRPDQRRGKPEEKHCGVCMPCVYRRAALDLVDLDSENDYGDPIQNLDWNSKRGQDVGACLEFIKKDITKENVKNELIINGIKNLNKINEYCEVVLRTRKELESWVTKIKNDRLNLKAGIK